MFAVHRGASFRRLRTLGLRGHVCAMFKKRLRSIYDRRTGPLLDLHLGSMCKNCTQTGKLQRLHDDNNRGAVAVPPSTQQ
jgi:hypothetical protein